MTPTDAQTEAVAKAIYEGQIEAVWGDLDIPSEEVPEGVDPDDMYDVPMTWEQFKKYGFISLMDDFDAESVLSMALAAIAALDIEKIEREAYERVRRILLSRDVSDYLDEVFMEPEYWDSEHDDFSGKLVHYLNMEKVMSVLVTNWLGDEEIKDFDDE